MFLPELSIRRPVLATVMSLIVVLVGMLSITAITVGVDGAQYVIVVAGGSNYEGGWGSAVLVFGLPEPWRPR